LHSVSSFGSAQSTNDHCSALDTSPEITHSKLWHKGNNDDVTDKVVLSLRAVDRDDSTSATSTTEPMTEENDSPYQIKQVSTKIQDNDGISALSLVLPKKEYPSLIATTFTDQQQQQIISS
jgi:hypothetical protein